MIFSKSTLPCFVLMLCLGACQPATETGETSSVTKAQETSQAKQAAQTPAAEVETIIWEDLMPEGEDQRLEELYAEFYEKQENQYREQLTLSQAAKADTDIISLIDEGSAQDTMEQIGTYNVVADLNGANIRLPGYVVPLDFNASFEYTEFLLVPYFGACLHTPPPPPNQIVYVKSAKATKIANINEPVWIEGVMKTGQFGSELGNSAYELTLSKLEPYEY